MHGGLETPQGRSFLSIVLVIQHQAYNDYCMQRASHGAVLRMIGVC
jgi:hypothetical protein